jgi:hypothetical protein
MTKTCYFCEEFDICFSENNNAENVVTDIGILCNMFTPNADWLEYEELKKENEELKRKIQSYKYEREKLHGYLAKSEVKDA